MRVAEDRSFSSSSSSLLCKIPVYDNISIVPPLTGSLAASNGNLYLGSGSAWISGGGSGVTSLNSRTGNIFLDGSSSITITEGPNGTFTFDAPSITNATPLNIPNTIVERDGTGSFAAQNVDMALAKLRVGVNTVNLSADAGLASTYNYKFPASAPTGTAQSITTSGSTNVFYDIHAQHEIVVRKNPGPNEYSSLSSALTAIPNVGPDAPSDTNRYAVYIHPGSYSEPACSVPSYVYVVGITNGGVVFSPSGAGYSLITLPVNSGLLFCSIKNTDASFPAIHSTGSCLIYKVNMDNCPMGIKFEPSSATNTSEAQLIKYTCTTSTYAIQCIDTNILGGFGNNIIINNLYFQGQSSNCIIVDGLNSKATLSSVSLTGDGTGAACLVNNGGILTITGAYVNAWATGISVPTTTGTPTVETAGVVYNNCTTNINVVDTNTLGFNDGYTAYAKTNYPVTAPYFIANKQHNFITVAAKGGDFTSITAAMASISGSSFFNPYTIFVAPGIYPEPHIDMKPYVSVVGTYNAQCIIVGYNPVQPLFSSSVPSQLSNLTLAPADPMNPPLYLVEYLGTSVPGGSFTLDSIILSTTGNGVYVGSTAGFCAFIARNCLIDPGTPITNGFLITDTGPGNNAIVGWIFGLFWSPSPAGAANLNRLVDIRSYKAGSPVPNVSIAVQACFTDNLSGTAVGTGFNLLGHILMAFHSDCFAGYQIGVNVDNSAEPTVLVIDGGRFVDDVMDIVVNNPNCVGSIFTSASLNKMSIVAGASIGVSSTDPAGGIVLSGAIHQGSTWAEITNITEQIQQDSATGVLYEQPAITPVGGLNISIPAGAGYVMVGVTPNDYLKYVTWSAVASFAVPGNALSWLYIDQNGTLNSTTGTAPDPISTIILGTVKTDGVVTYIQECAHVLKNLATNLDIVMRTVFGPIVSSGCLASPGSNVAQRAVAVSSGKYNLSVDSYPPAGGDNVSMIGYYGPSGSATQTAPFTNVPLQWDNAGVLTAITPGSWIKHSLYIISSLAGVTQYFFVYGQQQFASELDAQNGAIPAPPSTFVENMCPVAGIIVTDTDPSSPLASTRFRDIRPTIQFRATGTTASADHNSLLNLTVGDAHTQYFRTDGTRVMAGDIQLGTNNITGAGGNLLNGVDLSAHASRHLPGGADALTTAAPVSISSFNSIGVAASFSRSDHVHRGVSSLKANAGAQDFGDIILNNGTNVSIVEAPAGTFTFNVPNGAGGVSTFSAGTTGLAPNVASTGSVVLSGVLNAANGGTGQSVYAVGDILYADTTSTLSKLSDVAAGSYLRSGGVGTAPLWSILTLPNSATTGDLLFASSSNTIGNLADVAVNNVLLSGGVGAAPSWGKVANAALVNSSVTVTAGTGLSGGGAVSLGSSVTLTNAGVLSVTANAGSAQTGNIVLNNGTNLTITESPAGTYTFNVPNGAGGVSSIAGTASQIAASSSTGAVTLSLTNPINVNTTGSAATLTTARTINGVAFDGSANITVTAAAGTLTGTTLNSTVVSSSLTSVGTIATGVWNGTAIDAMHGGTGQTTWTTGDLLYASAGNTLSKLGIGSAGKVLTVLGGIPSWQPASGGGVSSITGTTNQINASSSTGAVTLSLAEPATAITSATSGITNTNTYISSPFAIDANTITAGDTFKITAVGSFSNNNSATATFRVRMDTTLPTFNAIPPVSGNTTLLTSSSTTASNGFSATAFNYTAYITFRSPTAAIGSSVLSNFGTTGISNAAVVPVMGSTTPVITSSQFYLGVTYISSNGSNTATFQQVIVERVR